MQTRKDRPARKNDLRASQPTLAPVSPRRRARALLLGLVAAVAAAAITAPSAGAITGGASGFTASTPSPTSKGATSRASGFSAWQFAGASWYGPGLYGNGTACGGRLRPSTVGVAHKTLPCGTLVKFRHRGHVVVAPVIDRGPYISGRAWDLTEAAAEALDFEGVGVGRVQYAIATGFTRTR